MPQSAGRVSKKVVGIVTKLLDAHSSVRLVITSEEAHIIAQSRLMSKFTVFCSDDPATGDGEDVIGEGSSGVGRFEMLA